MKNRNISLRGIGIACILIILLSLCVSFGLWFASPSAVYADGEPVVSAEPEQAEPAENKWEKDPDIVRWTYGSFKKETNIVTGKVTRGGIVYSVCRKDLSIIDGLKDFTVNEKGEVTAEVESVLKKLPAGDYTLMAVAAESDGTDRLTATVEFSVIMATNNWLVPPAVLGWRYREYNETVNFINAVPAYGAETMTFLLYAKDKNGKYSIKDLSGKGLAPFGYESEGKFPDYVIKGLTELDAGTYSLVPYVPATKNYTGLNPEATSVSDGGAVFEVLKTENTWQSAPSIVQWDWDKFSASVNLLTAVPALPVQPAERTVKFGVYTDPRCIAGTAVPGLYEFTTKSGTANREEVESERIADLLKALPAGDYYLLAETEGGANFTGLKTSVPFTVHKNPNKWKITPNVVQWTWNEYNPDVNVVTAIPEYPVKEAEVRYNVFKEDGVTFAFEQPQEGFVFDGDAEALFASLGAGTYYLKAVALESENYGGLNSTVPFKVQKAQNHWTTTPSLIEWGYGEFDNSVNRITASAAHGDVGITVYDVDGDKVLFDDNGNISASFALIYADGVPSVPAYVASAFNKLKAGEYYLLASVPDVNDYTGLNDFTKFEDIKSHAIKFNVSAAANGWVTVPKILSWSEGHYDAETNKIYAEAKAGNDKLTIFIIDNSNKRILTSNSGGNSLDYDLISKLSVGSYTVRFEITATDNYEGLDGEITFAVFEDSVGLGGIIAAVIVFAVFDLIAAGVCIALIIVRRRKIEQGFRNMVRKELRR